MLISTWNNGELRRACDEQINAVLCHEFGEESAPVLSAVFKKGAIPANLGDLVSISALPIIGKGKEVSSDQSLCLLTLSMLLLLFSFVLSIFRLSLPFLQSF